MASHYHGLYPSISLCVYMIVKLGAEESFLRGKKDGKLAVENELWDCGT